MYLPLPTPSEMSQWDRIAIEDYGLPGFTLMETASREAVAALLDDFGSVDGVEILCVAGGGNNGGDAFAMARHLMDLGADVSVFHAKPKGSYRGEARSHLRLAQKVGVHLKHISAKDLKPSLQPDILIDGLLGTGFEGDLRDEASRMIKAMNRIGEGAFVLSIDIPSGLSGLTGKPQPIAVCADATATFEAAKLGLTLEDAPCFTGSLHVCEIGIPHRIQNNAPPKHWLITPHVMSAVPPPCAAMHKGDAGHVLIVGGSSGMTGAPHLAALGALRSGAGLVTIACPGGLADSVKSGCADLMTLPLGKGSDWNSSLLSFLTEELDRFDAVVVGPGIGREAKTVDFIQSFVAECPAPLVVDADALYAVAQDAAMLDSMHERTILTPHPGEMARLTGLTSSAVQENRLEALELLMKAFRGTLVLKGAKTLVSDGDMNCVSPISAPNLSVGGSGDVLAGMIASLVGRGVPSLDAACAAVYWHGLTGQTLAEEFPARGNLATDIANTLPTAAKEHIEC